MTQMLPGKKPLKKWMALNKVYKIAICIDNLIFYTQNNIICYSFSCIPFLSGVS